MVDALSIDGSGGSVGRAVAHYFLIPTSAFTLAPLVARSGGTPCSTLSFCLL